MTGIGPQFQLTAELAETAGKSLLRAPRVHPRVGRAAELGASAIRDNHVELESEINVALIKEDRTGGWLDVHFDIPEPMRRLECRIAPTQSGGIYYTAPSAGTMSLDTFGCALSGRAITSDSTKAKAYPD